MSVDSGTHSHAHFWRWDTESKRSQPPAPRPVGSLTPAELPQTRQPVQVVGTGPDLEPPVTLRRTPAARPCRRLRAVGRLEVVVVHHPPAASSLGDEAGRDVAGLGHRSHGSEGRPCPRPQPRTSGSGVGAGHLSPPTVDDRLRVTATSLLRSASRVLIRRAGFASSGYPPAPRTSVLSWPPGGRAGRRRGTPSKANPD